MPITYSAIEVMEMAIETERGGKAFYETVAAHSNNGNLKDLFLYLAGEEDRHIHVFENIAKSVKVAPSEEPANWEDVTLYLKALTQSRYFLGHDKALTLARDANTPAQAVDYALAFEKETLVFYLEVEDMMSSANRPAVQALIGQERAHVRKLTEFSASLKNG